MSNCPNCGAEVRPGARFCARCGSLQSEAGNIPPSPGAAPLAPTQKAQEPGYPQAPTPSAGGGYPPPPAGYAGPPNNAGYPPPINYQPPPPIEPQPIRATTSPNRAWLGILAGVLTAVILFGVAAFLVIKNADNIFDWGVKKAGEKIVESIPTAIGTVVPKIQTEIPKIATDIATSEPMNTLQAVVTEAGFSIPTGLPFFGGDENTTIDWSSDSETYYVEIQDGEVIDGEATTQYQWTAVEGTYDNDILVVHWKTSEISGCNSEMTQTYNVDAEQLQLTQSEDSCGNVTNYQDTFYTRD